MAETARPRPRRGWGFWGFIALMLALMVLFAGLGIWQVERLGEKEHLLAEVAERMHLAPRPLPPTAEWGAFDADAWDYRPVILSGTWLPAQTLRVFTSLGEAHGAYSGPGYWVMTPLALAAGGTVFVNRGFVPQDAADAFVGGGALDPGLVSVTGIARRSEAIGAFTPQPDKAGGIEWVRGVARLAQLTGSLPEPVAPIYVDLPATAPRALPQGGETVVDFPNNHLGYAMTWFGFAVLVPFLLFFWARRQRAKA